MVPHIAPKQATRAATTTLPSLLTIAGTGCRNPCSDEDGGAKASSFPRALEVSYGRRSSNGRCPRQAGVDDDSGVMSCRRLQRQRQEV
ncbi:hypothetical protein DAI22_01g265200 [Oryza sativa Japonica Group]|nr:hypothetical protein DAI22_01g265200 [Oryza sativa Japonica Group]